MTLSEEIFQHCRDTVAALSGPPLHLTFADLLDRALTAEVKKLREEYNHGNPFPHFAGRRKPGRPLGT